MKKLFQLSFLPLSSDLALLLVRVWYGLSMIMLHGWGKLTTFSEKSGSFSDPLGIGSQASMAGAIAGEVICSVLIILGLFTRVAAVGAAFTMAIALFLVHKGVLGGANGGEKAYLYLGVYLALFFAGAGRFSMDRKLGAA